MKKLEVHYSGWGEDWLLGTLADDGNNLLFEYSAAAIAEQLQLSPIHLKLRSATYAGFPAFQNRLPGVIADALPDGWGMLLMDRYFRKQGWSAGPLERLAFIGDRAMGALRFTPATPVQWPNTEISLLELTQESQQVLAGNHSKALLDLLGTGGSPQGARPKVLLQYNPQTAQIGAQDKGSQPWLIKFQAQNEHKEVCAIEHLYAQLAPLCGIEMPETAYFELSKTHSAFGVARFDRVGDIRVPVHSLSGLLHADFRMPSLSYKTYLQATRLLTRDEREVQKAYRRALFNVVFHNRDDHAKNFAYCLGQDRQWRLAPAFDLTFSHGPAGEHQTDVSGEGRSIGRAHLLQLAKDAGLDKRFAEQEMRQVLDVAGEVRRLAAQYPIRASTLKTVLAAIQRQCGLLAH